MHSPRLIGLLGGLAALLISSLGAAPVAIGSLTEDSVEQTVTIQGTVADYQASTGERVPHRVLVRDQSGSVMVVFWPDIMPPVQTMPTQGAEVTITGEVGIYRGQLQIRARDGNAVQVTAGGTPVGQAQESSDEPMAMLIGMITTLENIGYVDMREVLVEGEITSIRPSGNPTAPHQVSIRDASGTGLIVIWPEVWDVLNPAPEVGNTIRAQGRRQQHRDNWQIAVRDPLLVILTDGEGRILSRRPGTPARPEAETEEAPSEETAAPAAASEPLQIPLAEIDGTHVGQRIRLSGQVVSVRPSWNERAPNILTVTDGTSTMPVVIWNDDYSALPHPAQPGNRFNLVGQINLYEQRNEIQIVPDEFTYAE